LNKEFPLTKGIFNEKFLNSRYNDGNKIYFLSCG